jgi:exonuclease SbcC
MIKQVRAINYESQKNTVLDFHPGLNVLVGESDRGKSGFFRAFNKCRTNRPLGSGMKPLYWEGDGLVQVTFDNDQTVSWIQNKSGNFYQIGDSDLINAGTDVPEEVRTIFNMDEINCQSQIDRSFLMFETSGERGRILNKLAGLDKIDSTMANAKSDIRKIQSNKKIQDGLIKEYQDDIIKYKELPTAGDLLIKGKEIEKQIKQNEQDFISLTWNWNKKQELLRSVEKLKKLPELEKLVLKSQELLTEIDKNEILYQKINSAFASKYVLESDRIDQEKLDALSKLITESEKVFSEYKDVSWKLHGLDTLFRNKKDYILKIRDLKNLITTLEKKIPKQCPTCGGSIK